MRCRIARQDSDMHPDSFSSEPEKPFHRCAGKMRSARRRIDVSANAAAHDPAAAVDEIAVKAGVMVRILFHDAKVSAWRFVSAFAGRNRSVGDNLLADHQISALFGNGHDDMD